MVTLRSHINKAKVQNSCKTNATAYCHVQYVCRVFRAKDLFTKGHQKTFVSVLAVTLSSFCFLTTLEFTMQSSISSDDRDEFKLSFKPMTQNNGSANFMNQSSSILMTGYHDNASANSNSLLQQNPTPSNLSMFHPVSNQSMNLNTTSVTDTLPHNQSTNSHNLNASNLSFNPMKTVVESNNTHSANMLNSSLRHLPTDSEVIFYESVPIVVRSSAVESNTRNLTLKIEKVVQLPQNQQILSITLTYEVRFAIFPFIFW